MKNKKIISVLLALILAVTVFTIASAANYGQSLITYNSSTITGYGYTASSQTANWINTQCYLVVPGWGTAATGNNASQTNTKGPVYSYAYASVSAHSGEQMYTTCVHRLIINNVVQPSWWSQSNTITVP